MMPRAAESIKGGTEIAPRRSGSIRGKTLILLMDFREDSAWPYLFTGRDLPVVEPVAGDGW